MAYDSNDPQLTDKQSRFVEEYLVDLNATQAAIRSGYSRSTARQMGYENLMKPYIQDAIEEQKKARSKRLQLDADYFIGKLTELAQSALNTARLEFENDEGETIATLSDTSAGSLARQCLMDAAKISGVIVDKSQVEVTGHEDRLDAINRELSGKTTETRTVN